VPALAQAGLAAVPLLTCQARGTARHEKTHEINKRTTRCRDAWFLPESECGCIRPLATQAGWLLEEEKTDQALSELAQTCMRRSRLGASIRCGAKVRTLSMKWPPPVPLFQNA
jgi:hypothetical protein